MLLEIQCNEHFGITRNETQRTKKLAQKLISIKSGLSQKKTLIISKKIELASNWIKMIQTQLKFKTFKSELKF